MALSLWPVAAPSSDSFPTRVVFSDHAVATIATVLATAGYTIPTGRSVRITGWHLEDGSVTGVAFFLLIGLGSRIARRALVNSVPGNTFVAFDSRPGEVLQGLPGEDIGLGYVQVIAGGKLNGYIDFEIV